ncbi:glucosamine inositolphosphorylceramide transferase family protein [Azospirillum sp. sgz302134]
MTPLRVGVLVDGLEKRAWIARILEEIRNTDCAQLCAVVVRAPRAAAEPDPAEQADAARRQMFWRYQREDRESNTPQPDAFAAVDISPLVAGAEMLTVTPLETRYSDRFSDADVARIRALKLDVLLRFGFRILRGDVLSAARYGVWSFHHGDNRRYRGGPALFWEIYEGNPVSGVILQALDESLDSGLPLYRSDGATNQFSLAGNRNQAYWKAATFVGRVLRRVHRHGWERVAAEARAAQRNDPVGTLYRTPDNIAMVRFHAMLEDRRRAQPVDWRWSVVVRPRQPGVPLADALRTPGGWTLHAPFGHWYADPFLWERDGRTFLFFEDYSQAEGKGVVSVVEVLGGGRFSEPAVALRRPYHLSYPYVFAWGGALYMVPETRQNGTLELYRCVGFPDRWELDAVLMSGVEAVDATIIEHGGRLWMFTNIAAHGASSWDELHVFHAEHPAGPWTAHPGNPVVSDVRRARPAGRPFLQDGRLIRPAQDCSLRYGYALTFREVLELTPASFRECDVATVTPEPLGHMGVHTIDTTASYLVHDAYDEQVTLADFARQLPRGGRGYIFGAGTGGALVKAAIEDAFKDGGGFAVDAFIDSHKAGSHCGLEILGTEKLLAEGDRSAIIILTAQSWQDVAATLRAAGFRFLVNAFPHVARALDEQRAPARVMSQTEAADAMIAKYTTDARSIIATTEDLDRLPADRPVLVYGAGQGGQRMAALVRAAGRTVAGFVDTHKAGTLDGLPVHTVDSVLAASRGETVIIASQHWHEIDTRLIAHGMSTALNGFPLLEGKAWRDWWPADLRPAGAGE